MMKVVISVVVAITISAFVTILFSNSQTLGEKPNNIGDNTGHILASSITFPVLILGNNTKSHQDQDYNPDDIRIKVGDIVTWINDDAHHLIHTVTSEAGEFDSSDITPGQSFSLKFDKPGSYEYFCQIHPVMSGKVTVT
jgi:plastocyanin